MDLKFYLNKFLKVDRIEDYTLKTLVKLREVYEDFLQRSEGVDPDFPMLNFGQKGMQKLKGIKPENFVDPIDSDFQEFQEGRQRNIINMMDL